MEVLDPWDLYNQLAAYDFRAHLLPFRISNILHRYNSVLPAQNFGIGLRITRIINYASSYFEIISTIKS